MYTLERFDVSTTRLTLPTNRAIPIGSGRAEPLYAATPWGGVRVEGSEIRAMDPLTILMEAQIVGATATAAQTAWDAVKQWVGWRGKLYRRMPDGTVQWAWADLVEPSADRTVDHIRHADVSLEWYIPQPIWYTHHHGAGWNLDGGIYLDTGYHFDENDRTTLTTSPQNVDVNNGGNYPVSNAVITVTAGTLAITALTLTLTGYQLTYSGTIAAGQALVIDCGALTVKNNAVDAYGASWAFGAGHQHAEWLVLSQGNNRVVVSKTGGGTGSTILFDFWEGHA